MDWMNPAEVQRVMEVSRHSLSMVVVVVVVLLLLPLPCACGQGRCLTSDGR